MIQKILDKIIKFINWPYGVGGKQYIIKEKLFKLASIMHASAPSCVIKFKDTSGMDHSLGFVLCDSFSCTEKCIFVHHYIHVSYDMEEVMLEIFKILKEEDYFSLDEVHPIMSYEKYEKYGLFHRDTYIDYNELAKHMDLLMIKLL